MTFDRFGGTGAVTRVAPPRPRRLRLGAVFGWGITASLPLGFLVLFFVWPVIALVATGFVEDGKLSWEPLVQVAQEGRAWRVIGQTLLQASTATLISLVLGVPAAYVLYRLRFRGRQMLRGLLTIPFVLPTVVVGVAFTSLLGPGGALHWLGLDRTFVSVVIALAFFNITVVMRTVGGFWARLDARPAEAARTLGAGPARVWWTITLPALTPALASAAALVFLFCATSFGVVLILGGREFSNIETEIYRLTVQFLDLKSAAVLAVVQFAIVAAVLAISAHLRRRNERAVAMRAEPRAPRRADVPVLGVFGVTVALMYVLPLFSVVRRSFLDVSGSFSLGNYTALITPPESSPLTDSVLSSMGLSLGIAVIATVVSMSLGVIVVLIASRRPRSRILSRSIDVFDGFIMLPLGVSAVTLGFGLLLTMHQPLGVGFDLRTSIVLIPVAQALVALPIVVRTMLPVLRGIDPRLREAATMLGASPARILRTIDAPMLGRAAGLALGFAFATSLGEFGATTFLVRPGAQTLPVIIAELIGHPAPASHGTALAAAVVLGTMTSIIMLLAERLRVGSNLGEW